MKQLTASQRFQVATFTPRQKLEALKGCSFPSTGFAQASEFVSNLLQKLAIEGDQLQLSPKQHGYLDLLFWQYRHQHNRLRIEQAKLPVTELPLDRDGTQQTLGSGHQGNIERIINKDL